jgi:hypothetical protein
VNPDRPLWVTLCALAGVAILAVGIASTACTASQARQAAGAGVVAALDCELVHVDADLAADLKSAAIAKVDAWISGKAGTDLPTLIAAVKADLAAFRSDAGRCAIAAVLAAAASLVTSRPAESGLVALPAGPPPAMVRAAFGLAAREAGLPPLRVAGAVL